MNKIISGIAQMIIIRSKISRDGATNIKSDYLRGRADEADYILDTLKTFYPDEVAEAFSSQPSTTTDNKQKEIL